MEREDTMQRSLQLCAVLIGLTLMSGCGFYSQTNANGEKEYKAVLLYNILPERPAIGDTYDGGWSMNDNEWYNFPRNSWDVQFYLLRNTPTDGFWQIVIDSARFDGPGSVIWDTRYIWNAPIPFRIRSTGETGNGRLVVFYDYIDYYNGDRKTSAFRNKWVTKSLKEIEDHLRDRDAQLWNNTRDELRDHILQITSSTSRVDTLIPTDEKKRSKQKVYQLMHDIRKVNPKLADAIEPKVRERMFETLVAREFMVQFNFRFLQRVAVQNVNYGW
ncbi:MAG: hypothetical protein A2898_02525 [Candidatus Kerfeldbacteria bacterium RIFCSPLOWO2_01_FULL_48_11]|uniref:Lipoprotein n=1 Tax=Candidatus Kerfeldbacteria bacterium RIFCSPLOWO2_01_FULL_48_11 TaxID=1798543 RepID=A0A1G2B4H2_9BACT|nr:MAG: hypothetical protein UY34_C0012G0007 [Parcubacteria group bacterium GW2011_GWA2_48_9]KKW14744.1 MAG: hypothetical protein UY52_C0022G0023 [Parcubacteria group bacterium GW2011_GWC2_49_9]OGY83127.1 MAG: hypothetical protein A2898_02525 [Candidatus Kerfeldbacteria bacterium RIFCSPLOWO2_01_FULL_48_11]HCJ52237.1 hypothetical protein [Candidatus Kerfeldbacteria bacterium]HCM67850.1 hypothetical protein [Candidatus Kerfeldbacteria bacterium]